MPSYEKAAFTNGYEFTQGSGYVLPEYPFVEPPELRTGQTGRAPVVGGAWGVGSVIGGMLLWACPSWACCCRA